MRLCCYFGSNCIKVDIVNVSFIYVVLFNRFCCWIVDSGVIVNVVKCYGIVNFVVIKFNVRFSKYVFVFNLRVI